MNAFGQSCFFIYLSYSRQVPLTFFSHFNTAKSHVSLSYYPIIYILPYQMHFLVSKYFPTDCQLFVKCKQKINWITIEFAFQSNLTESDALREKCSYWSYSGPYFTAFGLNTVFSPNAGKHGCKCGKTPTRITAFKYFHKNFN